MTDTKTFRVPEQNFPMLAERIARLAKRAAKLGVEPPKIDCVGQETRQVYRVLGQGAICPADHPAASPAETKKIFLIQIVGTTPKLAGWTFVATLQHLTGEDGEQAVILRGVPGQEIPEVYRDADPSNCDHCHVRIKNRKDTFVLRHDDGRYAQVGRDCLADFLGHVDPKALAAAAEIYAEVGAFAGDCEDEEHFGFLRAPKRWGLIGFLALTAAVTAKEGWVSRKKAREEGLPYATADRVLDFMTRTQPDARDPEPEVTDAHVAEAKAAIGWALDFDDGAMAKNDYLFNLHTLAKLAIVEAKLAGLAASLVPSYRRTMERERERKHEGAVSNFIGTPKKRETFVLTLQGTRECEGRFGVTVLHLFRDANGNRVKWFASNADVVPGKVMTQWGERDGMTAMEVGHTYRVKGTVKSHEEYRGVKETVLSRCAVEGEVALDAPVAA